MTACPTDLFLLTFLREGRVIGTLEDLPSQPTEIDYMKAEFSSPKEWTVLSFSQGKAYDERCRDFRSHHNMDATAQFFMAPNSNN